MSDLPLLDLMHAPPVDVPFDRNAEVLQGEPDEVLSLPQRRLAWLEARIDLHRDRARDLWMWSTRLHIEGRGYGYSVGEKWGKFAATRADALHWARVALLGYLDKRPDTPATQRIRRWAEGLS